MQPRCTIDGMILRALRYYFSDRNSGQDAAGEVDTTPISEVKWESYTGRWYEWARYETPFEFELDEVYTDYTMGADGTLSITNCGTDAKGHRKMATAKATIAGEGKLSVSFIPFLRFLSTPYHVLYVDEGYSRALVSNESGSCLWLLGRTPLYTTIAYRQLLNEAVLRGFNTQHLRLTEHRQQAL